MAWTSLSFAFGSLLTSTKMTQLYDNITAVADGDSGAPRIKNAGLNPPASGTTYTLCTLIGNAAVETTDIAYLTNVQERVSLRDRHLSAIVLVSGTITCNLQHYKSTFGSGSVVRVLRNSTVIQEWSTTSTTAVSRTVNVTCAIGDVIAFQQKANSSGSSYWLNVTITSANQDIAIA